MNVECIVAFLSYIHPLYDKYINIMITSIVM